MSSLDGDFRNKPREEEDHAGTHAKAEVRWLLPYADMITLLLALFIMLYAAADTQETQRLQALSDSVNKAFNGKEIAPVQQASPNPSRTQQALSDKLLNSGMTLAQLQEAAKLAKERKAEDASLRRLQAKIDRFAARRGFQRNVKTIIDERGLVVRLISDQVLFDTGSARVRPAALPLLDDIAGLLKTEPNHVRVEGHTDNVPITGSLFSTNWELSAIRATTVVRRFIRDGMSSGKLSAAGYAYRRPLDSNKTEKGRQRNRRVEIVVLRRAGLTSQQSDGLGG